MSKDIVPNLTGAIPNPISKKFLKKASANQPLVKENSLPNVHAYTAKSVKEKAKHIANKDDLHDWLHRENIPPNHPYHAIAHKAFNHMHKNEEVAGFADASAPSNSNYQTELSPTQTAKRKKMGKKTVKETYEKRIYELANICPQCNNTGMMRKFGQNMLCDAPNCSAGGDKRNDQENLMFRQAREMIGTGKTTAVAEDVVSSVEDVEGVLEAYKASDKLLSRTKYLVQPKLSRTLRDRLDARRAKSSKDKDGYTPSHGTLGLAAARKAQMSNSKVNEEKKKKPNYSASTPGKAMSSLTAKPMMGSENNNRVSEENLTEISKKTLSSYTRKAVADVREKSHARGMSAGLSWGKTPDHAKDDAAAKKISKRQAGITKAVSKIAEGEINELSKKTLKSYVQNAAHSAVSAGHEAGRKMGAGETEEDKPNYKKVLKRMKGISKATTKLTKEEYLADGKTSNELKKFTGGDSKKGVKRKYLGAIRGRTATGKPAHQIEVDPVISTNNDVNKIVKS